jgi:hypothetical protein
MVNQKQNIIKQNIKNNDVYLKYSTNRRHKGRKAGRATEEKTEGW